MEVPRLGVEWELQLLAYTTAIAMQDLSCVCSLHHSLQPCQILNPLSEARDQTCNLVVLSGIRFHCTTTVTPCVVFLRYTICCQKLKWKEWPLFVEY